MKQRERRWRESILHSMLSSLGQKKLLPFPKMLRSLREKSWWKNQVRKSSDQERLFQGDGKDKRTAAKI